MIQNLFENFLSAVFEIDLHGWWKVYETCSQAAVCLVLVHGVRIYAKKIWPSKRGGSSGTLEALQFLVRGFELDLDNKFSLSKRELLESQEKNHKYIKSKTTYEKATEMSLHCHTLSSLLNTNDILNLLSSLLFSSFLLW